MEGACVKIVAINDKARLQVVFSHQGHNHIIWEAIDWCYSWLPSAEQKVNHVAVQTSLHKKLQPPPCWLGLHILLHGDHGFSGNHPLVQWDVLPGVVSGQAAVSHNVQILGHRLSGLLPLCHSPSLCRESCKSRCVITNHQFMPCLSCLLFCQIQICALGPASSPSTLPVVCRSANQTQPIMA